MQAEFMLFVKWISMQPLRSPAACTQNRHSNKALRIRQGYQTVHLFYFVSDGFSS